MGIPDLRLISLTLASALALQPWLAAAQTAPVALTQLPEPTGDPMAIDPAGDPVLALATRASSGPAFKDFIEAAIVRNPGLGEARAGREEAFAARGEARAQQWPSGEISISNFQTLARDFSNDPENIIERSRARQRTDALLSLQQPLIDFGASKRRIEAATARIDAASAEVEQTSASIALQAIGAWYDVFGYRALVALGESFAASQRELNAAVDERVAQGVSAAGDAARVQSYIASAETRLAGYRRLLANAEARFEQLTGAPPPPGLMRAPMVGVAPQSQERAEMAAAEAPQVRAAQALALASRNDAKASRADTLPRVTAGVDAGRYGVFETERDYDIRGRVTLRQPLFGGTESRVDQANARARSADARAYRIREEAIRDAAIAWSDVQALEEQIAALEKNYIASRRSRDVLAERYRVARGSLFDLLATEDSYFLTAASYIQTLTELDTARYVLLARTGELLGALDVAPPTES